MAPILRPDITVAQVILLMLAQQGKLGFRDIRAHPSVKILGGARTENSFYTALSRLQRRRQIIRNGHVYELTTSGQYAALKAYIRKEITERENSTRAVKQKKSSSTSTSENCGTPQPWDGKWRIVFFDVPEQKRPLRDYLRGVLKRFGFYEFQRSMWIYPYKLPPFLKKTFDDPIFHHYVRTITTYDINYEDDLVKKFRLV